jgi:hypothetical protein
MTRALSFVFLDGREVEGSTPRAVFEALRKGEASAPDDLGRYLDLLASREALTFSVVPDVGAAGADVDVRCRQALASFIEHGWLRVKKAPATWPPQPRRPHAAAVALAKTRLTAA